MIGHAIEAVVAWTHHEGMLGLAGFSLLFIVLALTMLPTLEMYVAAGLVYGTGWGTLLMTVLSLVGAMLAYAISRTSVRRWIERGLGRHEKLQELDRGIGEHAFSVATLLRLAPILPYGATSYALGASRIKPGMYALTAIVGTLPTNLMYAYAGSLLHRVADLKHPPVGHALLLWGGIAATVVVTLLLGWIAKQALARASKA